MDDYDPRIVGLYDGDNPGGADHAFYRALADERSASSILDLGCGTGILTVTFSRPGRTVVGVDPSPSMLAYARRRPGAETVSWQLGDSRHIPTTGFDLAVMTGNAAQHVPESDWSRTLSDLRAALTEGGTLAFESRNPAARAWEGWSSPERTTRETAHGTLVEWMDAEETAPGVVKLTAHNLFVEQEETVVETELIHFREAGTITASLEAAGFEVEAVYGDWHRHPFTGDEPIMVFVARAS